ncbi:MULTISPECIES: hypothetical protein [Pacificibacter]|uniref:hypothetical protein n=1 Tax=Pacificibacter TaxID=1042323 RepID=UPI001C0965A5|nr:MULTISPECIES: hypothetical protein [Pacificibacter]MBU2934642.1 hypothetical protein [Pacificibacter marinus]MDO6616487.1 hypothetical protein [Pacificibacter sp. 1_MG-2023]
MKTFLKTLMIATIASSAFTATAAHAISDAEFQQMKKDCIAIGKRIGVRADGSYGCGSEPAGRVAPEGATTGAAQATPEEKKANVTGFTPVAGAALGITAQPEEKTPQATGQGFTPVAGAALIKSEE